MNIFQQLMNSDPEERKRRAERIKKAEQFAQENPELMEAFLKSDESTTLGYYLSDD